MFPCVLRRFPFVPGRQETIDHWKSGKDFIITHTGQHCSIRDVEALKRDFPILAVHYAPGLYMTLEELEG